MCRLERPLLHDLLEQAVRRGASDLILVAGAPPTLHLGGAWQPMDAPALRPDDVASSLHPCLTPEQQAELTGRRDLDFAIAVPGAGRFRANLHFQRGTLAAAFRAIPADIPPFERLGLPPQVLGLADYPSGLVLVTGCTGQGKSTTLASLLQHLNTVRPAHIITIEDPVEFEFSHGLSIIEQRQVGEDSPSFASALRHVLRQRPDVILIGELRDLETMATALTAAETGHLVFASLHTCGAPQTIARIIDVFPAGQQPHVRTQLAASLRAILSQQLVRDESTGGLVPATEILVSTAAIRRAIRDNETHLLPGMIETGRAHGMHTLEQDLARLVHDGRLPPEAAHAAAADPARLERLIGPRPDAPRACNAGAPPPAARQRRPVAPQPAGGVAAPAWASDA